MLPHMRAVGTSTGTLCIVTRPHCPSVTARARTSGTWAGGDGRPASRPPHRRGDQGRSGVHTTLSPTCFPLRAGLEGPGLAHQHLRVPPHCPDPCAQLLRFPSRRSHPWAPRAQAHLKFKLSRGAGWGVGGSAGPNEKTDILKMYKKGIFKKVHLHFEWAMHSHDSKLKTQNTP